MYGYYREKLHFDHFWDLRSNGDLTIWCQYATSVWWKVLWFSQNYVEQLLEHRCIVLCGQQGLGKSYLASKLAEHVVQRQVNFLKNLQTLFFCTRSLSCEEHEFVFAWMNHFNSTSEQAVMNSYMLMHGEWWRRGGGCTESDDGGRGLILFPWEFLTRFYSPYVGLDGRHPPL